jgi:hypothetical protein
MSEPSDLERRLMLARRGLAASVSARERVLAGLSREIPALASLASAPPALSSPPLADPPAPGAGTGSAAGSGAPFWTALRMTGLRGVGLGGLLVAVGFSAGYVARGSSDESTTPRAASTVEAPPAPAPETISSSDPAATAPAAGQALPLAPPPLAPPSAAQPSVAPPAMAPPEREFDAERRASVRPHLAERRPSAVRHEASHDLPNKPPLGLVEAERTGLERELALLRRAERALRKGNPDFALALLDELEAKGSSAMLAQERSATRLLAACQVRAEGAERAAAAFIAAHPESVYVARLESSCRSLHGDTQRERAVGAPAPAALPPAAVRDGSPGGGH